ncbi:hypothetical protein CK203_042097 [Vitis vinifera]|uniref:Uncharacterized protein n=1 Tax=Vitis vinifera TaxID=29760 RepID=A0A438HHC3_VITVI|nr:hypothetical protein CK203_042097 [Vitis vinifera]
MPDVIYEMSGVTLGPRTPAPFRLVPDEAASVQAATAPHSDDLRLWTFSSILREGEYETATSSRCARPLGVHHPKRSTHRDALTRALSQIRVDTTTTPEGLIHMMTAGRATFPSVLLDNGSALNVCPLATAIALGYAPSDFSPSTQTVRAYDSTRREVMGTLEIELLIGPAPFVTVFQKVKFIHDGQVVVVQSVGDMFIAAELGARYYAEHVLSTRHGLGQRQHGPSEFITIPDHDVPFGLGFIPTEADYRHMARLRKERVRARLTHTSFYYPVRPYTMSLADYFVRASEPHAPSDGIIVGLSTTQEVELQRLVQQLQLSDGAPGPSASIGDVVDGAVPRDEYVDEMLAMSLSQTEEIAPPELASPFDLFWVSVLELALPSR